MLDELPLEHVVDAPERPPSAATDLIETGERAGGIIAVFGYNRLASSADRVVNAGPSTEIIVIEVDGVLAAINPVIQALQ